MTLLILLMFLMQLGAFNVVYVAGYPDIHKDSLSTDTLKAHSSTNVTTPTLRTPSGNKCYSGSSKVCTYEAPSGTTMLWETYKPSTTITAATVQFIVNNITNTTQTTTLYNKLPVGVTLPPRNSAGTHTYRLTIGKSSWTEIAYPTTWRGYRTSIEWSGSRERNGTCTTENCLGCNRAVYLPATLDPVFSEESKLASLSTDPSDRQGLHYRANVNGGKFLQHSWLESIMPPEDRAMLTTCNAFVKSPPQTLQAVHFLTDTITAYAREAPVSSPLLGSPATQAEVPQTTTAINTEAFLHDQLIVAVLYTASNLFISKGKDGGTVGESIHAMASSRSLDSLLDSDTQLAHTEAGATSISHKGPITPLIPSQPNPSPMLISSSLGTPIQHNSDERMGTTDQQQGVFSGRAEATRGSHRLELHPKSTEDSSGTIHGSPTVTEGAQGEFTGSSVGMKSLGSLALSLGVAILIAVVRD